MTIVLIIIVLILIGLLIWTCTRVEFYKDIVAEQHKDLVQAGADYVALEQGRDEETESYQQELLTADETVAMLKELLATATEELRNCIVDHTKVLEMVLNESP